VGPTHHQIIYTILQLARKSNSELGTPESNHSNLWIFFKVFVQPKQDSKSASSFQLMTPVTTYVFHDSAGIVKHQVNRILLASSSYRNLKTTDVGSNK